MTVISWWSRSMVVIPSSCHRKIRERPSLQCWHSSQTRTCECGPIISSTWQRCHMTALNMPEGYDSNSLSSCSRRSRPEQTQGPATSLQLTEKDSATVLNALQQWRYLFAFVNLVLKLDLRLVRQRVASEAFMFIVVCDKYINVNAHFSLYRGTLSFSALTFWLGDRKGIKPKTRCWFVGVTFWLELATSYKSSCHHHHHHP